MPNSAAAFRSDPRSSMRRSSWARAAPSFSCLSKTTHTRILGSTASAGRARHDGLLDEIGGERVEALGARSGPHVLELDVATLEVAEVAEPMLEPSERGG